MMVNSVNNFEKGFKYKLYRTVYEVVHPTISKKNISSYRIVFKDDILPVRVFYPKKVSNINKIIFYIPGFGDITGCFGKYAEICKKVALGTDTLVIAMDMDDVSDNSYFNIYELCNKTCLYLYDELEKLNIENLKIYLMGDSLGANVSMGLAKNGKFSMSEMILFYPVLSTTCFNKDVDYEVLKNIKKYFSDNKLLKSDLIFPALNKKDKYDNNILFVVGEADPMKDDIIDYYGFCKDYNSNNDLYTINLCGHGFLDGIDEIALTGLFEKMNEFMNR